MNMFPFHYAKAAQTVASLLRLEHPAKMPYYRLLKLLYIADRTSIEETGRPIIGGRLIALKRGPLHDTVYQIIKGIDRHSPEWAKFFSVERHDIEMRNDPGNEELSPYELGLLERLTSQFRNNDEWEIGDHTHTFQEFIQNIPEDSSRKEIPLEQVIAAVGRAADRDAILKDARDVALFDRVFGG